MSQDNITDLLNKWLTGDEKARNELFDLVYDDLRVMAKRYLARENPGHTLRPTALVNEAYLKVQAYNAKEWESRAHFYALFSRVMRHILVDHARHKLTQKGGADLKRVSLDEVGEVSERDYVTLIELNTLLDRLSKHDVLASSVFDLKHFTGLTADEIADVLEINLTKVNRSLKYAKLWLQRELKSTEDGLASMEHLQEPAL